MKMVSVTNGTETTAKSSSKGIQSRSTVLWVESVTGQSTPGNDRDMGIQCCRHTKIVQTVRIS